MAKILVANTTEPQLDWLVGVCEGYQAVYANRRLWPVFRKGKAVEATWPAYTTDWAQGGPIIEQEGVSLCKTPHPSNTWNEAWMATDCNGQITEYGNTPLTAVMRCYVASKLGEEVEVPNDL